MGCQSMKLELESNCFELFYYEMEDYKIAAWYFQDEQLVRVYLNGYHYDTISVEVK